MILSNKKFHLGALVICDYGKVFLGMIKKLGFTIAELLIAMVVIGILSAMSFVSYNGLKQRAQNVLRKNDVSAVKMRLETYAAQNNDQYPVTTNNPTANWKTIDVRTDSNCFNGSKQTDWVPSFESLPQSVPNTGIDAGVGGNAGCYLYASNGTQYVLSAWNTLSSPQASSLFYRRLGFRSFQTPTSAQFFSCNDNAIGGISQGHYDISKDYYKYSYTVSNITDCDETPPSGV